MRPDIEHNEDVVQLVDRFYNRVMEDDILSSIFQNHMSIELKAHMPIMYRFWQSVLLDTMTYRGNVMIKHIELSRMTALTDKHFDRWIHLWETTVDQLFEGRIAEAAKEKAHTMGELMKYKIKRSQDSNTIL